MKSIIKDSMVIDVVTYNITKQYTIKNDKVKQSDYPLHNIVRTNHVLFHQGNVRFGLFSLRIYFLDEIYKWFCSVCKTSPFFYTFMMLHGRVRECNSIHLFRHRQHTTLIISISVVALTLKTHNIFPNFKSSESWSFYWMTLNSRRHGHLPYTSRKRVCSKVFVRRWTNLYANTCCQHNVAQPCGWVPSLHLAYDKSLHHLTFTKET